MLMTMSETKPYSLTIGMATGGVIRTETVARLIPALWELKKRGYEVRFCPMIGGNVSHNRNTIARQAVADKSDYLMFIDNDMMFPSDGILRLIDCGKDIVAAPYNQRALPQTDNSVRISTVKLVDKHNELVGGTVPTEVATVGGVGTGFMLIKTGVFEKMNSPWFVDYEDEHHEFHGEDVNFCVKARAIGYEIWINPHIEIQHISEIAW